LDIFPLLLIRPFYSSCNVILSSYGIPAKAKGVETSKLIHSFLDSSSINSSNSRLVILLPIYCAINQVLSGFDLVVHNRLLRMEVQNLIDYQKSFTLILMNFSSHVQDALIKEGSEISTYIESLDLELDKKEIPHVQLETIGLPKAIQYDSDEDIMLIIQRDESKYFERKPYLTCNPINKCINKGKEFDVMRTIDSYYFLNTEGGLLIIGVDDSKTPLGLDGDYSIIKGDRNNFDKFQNHLRKLIEDTYFKNSIVLKVIN